MTFSETNRKAGPGRPKGSKNKLSWQVVNKLLSALGVLDRERNEDGTLEYPHGYLVAVAKTDPKAFLSALGKVLPKDIHLTHDIAGFDDALQELERTAKLVELRRSKQSVLSN